MGSPRGRRWFRGCAVAPESEPRVAGRAGGCGSPRGRFHSSGRGPRPQRGQPLAPRVRAQSPAGVADGNPNCVRGTDLPSSSPACPRGRAWGSTGAAERVRELATTEISTRRSGRGPSATATRRHFQTTGARPDAGHRHGAGGAGVDGGVPGRDPDCGGRRGEARPGRRCLQDLGTDSTTDSKAPSVTVTVRRTRGLRPRTRPLGEAQGVTEPASHPSARREGSGECLFLPWRSQSRRKPKAGAGTPACPRGLGQVSTPAPARPVGGVGSGPGTPPPPRPLLPGTELGWPPWLEVGDTERP